jgi:hypothetical protein
MAWQLRGTYFESCSCDAVCPCTWSALTAKATLDRCRALLAYHVESGQINDVDVSGLNFALFLDTPPVMSQGDWRVGVYPDDTATDSQIEQFGAVLSGQAGGPPAMLTVAPASAVHLSTFGIDWGREGQSGFSAPFSWSG